jgi:hypothetical protein
MRLRLTKVDEFQFLTCVKNEVWGSNSARFNGWKIGDLLVFIVEKQIAGLAEVSGPPYKSDKTVWDNGLFPNRIPIKFNYLFEKGDRPNILGTIREALISVWTNMYGWGILNQVLLIEPQAEIIFEEITRHISKKSEIINKLDPLLEDAKQIRIAKASKKSTGKRGRPKKSEIVVESKPQGEKSIEVVPLTWQEESLHSKAQYVLSRIGQITGCNIFIATNDRRRVFNKIELSTLTLPKLPNLGLNKDATERISRIDVIWLKQNAAICAFEVETSTSIYSGLLRMSDLISVIPNLNITLYIVAQEERKIKVLSELARPTFRKIGLDDYCKFISIEDLESLLTKIEDFTGYVHPSIIDNIAKGLSDDIDYEPDEPTDGTGPKIKQ